jgi:hypothetical protein
LMVVASVTAMAEQRCAISSHAQSWPASIPSSMSRVTAVHVAQVRLSYGNVSLRSARQGTWCGLLLLETAHALALQVTFSGPTTQHVIPVGRTLPEPICPTAVELGTQGPQTEAPWVVRMTELRAANSSRTVAFPWLLWLSQVMPGREWGSDGTCFCVLDWVCKSCVIL